MNPLLTIKGTLAVGFILALAIAYGMGNGLAGLNGVVWLHVLAGVVWIGLLYYFNFIQVPGVGAALANPDGPTPAAINKYIAPNAPTLVPHVSCSNMVNGSRRFSSIRWWHAGYY